jgi:membrane protease subunit HflK
VTRKRLFLETMERVLGDSSKIIMENNQNGGSGVVPYLPLNELLNSGAAGQTRTQVQRNETPPPSPTRLQTPEAAQ